MFDYMNFFLSPGQGCSLHFLDSSECPIQVSPPWSGRLHSLVRFCIPPPHVTEQLSHPVHVFQEPSTEMFIYSPVMLRKRGSWASAKQYFTYGQTTNYLDKKRYYKTRFRLWDLHNPSLYKMDLHIYVTGFWCHNHMWPCSRSIGPSPSRHHPLNM